MPNDNLLLNQKIGMIDKASMAATVSSRKAKWKAAYQPPKAAGCRLTGTRMEREGGRRGDGRRPLSNAENEKPGLAPVLCGPPEGARNRKRNGVAAPPIDQ